MYVQLYSVLCYSNKVKVYGINFLIVKQSIWNFLKYSFVYIRVQYNMHLFKCYIVCLLYSAEASFLVCLNMSTAFRDAIFSYNRTGFIPGSTNAPKNPPRHWFVRLGPWTLLQVRVRNTDVLLACGISHNRNQQTALYIGQGRFIVQFISLNNENSYAYEFKQCYIFLKLFW